jgi:hypothetical protein
MKTKVKVKTPARPLHQICDEIRKDWRPMPNYAKAHFEAIECATSIDEMYGFDSVKSEVCYFLGNAQTWKGETARRIKIELKQLVGLK